MEFYCKSDKGLGRLSMRNKIWSKLSLMHFRNFLVCCIKEVHKRELHTTTYHYFSRVNLCWCFISLLLLYLTACRQSPKCTYLIENASFGTLLTKNQVITLFKIMLSTGCSTNAIRQKRNIYFIVYTFRKYCI